jgi:hypothetical protein
MAVLQLLSIGESLLLDFGVGLLLIHNRIAITTVDFGECLVYRYNMIS